MIGTFISNEMDLLYDNNPWWKGEKDYHMEKWEGMGIRWQPEWIRDVSLKPFSLNVILGPRQTGKTTGIKILIHEMIRTKDPRTVFYFNCDFVPDLHTLKRVIDGMLELKETFSQQTAYIFLDEITNVTEWWRVVKGYIELGKFKNDVVTLLGSSSIRLKKSIELFPGRRGAGKTIVANPLTFRQFLQVHGLEIERTGKPEKDAASARGHEKEIRTLFGKYLAAGGFPLAINKDPRAREYFLDAFENELVKQEKNVNLIREIITAVLRKAPSPLNYSTIARETSGYSYKTVADYLETLRSLFILDYAYFKENKKVIYRKEKKLFFMDPFIASCLSSLYGEEYLKGALYEWIVQSHLLRKHGEIYYYRNRYEIDCIADTLKIEVKAGKPHRNYPKSLLVLDKESLPLWLAVV